MSNLLDHNPSTSPPERPYFAIAATAFGITTIALLIYASTIFSNDMSIGAMFNIPEWLPKGIKISFAVGVIFTILSFLWKEKTKAKWVGVLPNIFALIIFLAIFLYYRMLAKGFQ